MSKVGEISLELVIDKQKFNIEVNRLPGEAKAAGAKISGALSQSASSCGSVISGAFGKIGKTIAAAFSVKVVTDFTKQMVQSAAGVQAADSQFAQTFGNISDAASNAMKKVADESGIVQTRLQGVGTSIFAFAKTTGMDSANALNMMREALQVTADSAAYYDRSLEDTAESLKAFLKGNYANDAALGLSCTEVTRNTAANKLYGQSFKDLSEAQKQLTLLQMVKDANAASGALGQAARESDGLENVLGNLKEAWNQLLATIGRPVLQGAVAVIQRITSWIQRLTVIAKAAVSALSGLFGWNTEESNAAAASAQDTSNAIGGAVDNQEALTKEVKNTNDEVKRGIASFDKLNVISESKASGGSGDASDSAANTAVSDLAGPIQSEFELDTTNANSEIEKIKNKLSKIFEPVVKAYKKYIQPIVDKVKGMIDRLRDKFDKFKDDLDLDSIKASIGRIVESVSGFLDMLLPHIEYFIGEVLLPIALQIANHILPTINNWIADIVNFLKPIIDGLANILKPIWENILYPAFKKIAEWFEKIEKKVGPKLEILGEKIGEVFNKLQPVVEFLSQVLGPAIEAIMDVIGGSVSDGLTNLVDTIGDVFDALGGLIDFVVGVFTGDWEKAWGGIKDFFVGIVNVVIDVLNSLWITVYSTFALIANTIGGIIKGIGEALGHNDWGWEISGEAPLIPHLDEDERQREVAIKNTGRNGTGAVAPSIPVPRFASGKIIKAPTLAWVGDSAANASVGNPEVVAPLSDLRDMMRDAGSDYDTSLLTEILNYLKRLYELFLIFRSQGGGSYQFIAQLDGNTLFNEFVDQVNLYKRRHRGVLPW